ncbi:MAG: xanthine dehydrogenase family protein molybdopterin-binding subunit, partial [Cytophagaceae bacterium]
DHVTYFEIYKVVHPPLFFAHFEHYHTPIQWHHQQQNQVNLNNDQIYYAAQPVAVVVADTLERAQYAVTLVRVQYAAESPIASYQDPKAKLYIPESVQAGRVPGITKRGDAEGAFQQAPVQVSATYTNATTHHNPMEPGATTAHWESTDRLTIYESTQGVSETQRTLSTMLGMPREQIRVITKYIGGGFGCKLWVWPHTVLTSLAAKAVGRPVKLALTRPQQFTSMGLREEQQQDVKIGATREGKLLSLVYEKRSTTSPWDEYAELNSRIIGMLYALPTYQATYRLAHANVMTACATRAPGDAPGSYAIESAMDELAAKLGLNPLQLRLLNYAEQDSSNG